MQDGGPVSISQSNGSPPIREVVDVDEMQDGGPVSSSNSNELPAIPKAALLQRANADTPADISRIRQVSDRIASSEAVESTHVQVIKASAVVSSDSLSACALTLFLYAIRTHAMTRHFFLDRPSYRQLNFAAYQRHKDFLFLFDNPGMPFHFDSIKNTLQLSPFNGDRTLAAVMNHMFPREHGSVLNLIPSISLPRRDLATDPLTDLNQKVQNAILANVEANSAVDMSVVFIDFTAVDKKNNTATNIGFPTRVVFQHNSVHFVYQTIGAVYKRIEDGLDKYAIRIVSRGRCRGEYFYLDYFADYDSLDFNKHLPKGFNYQHEHDEKTFSKPFTKGIFPAEISAGLAKGAKVKYFLEGVVMSLNEGQTTGYFCRNYPNPGSTFQLSLGVLDPVSTCCGRLLRAREMKILESTEWLTDEIISAATLRFLKFNNYDEKSEGSPVILPPEVFTPMVETLIKDEDATRCRKTTKRVENAILFEEAYWLSTELWTHKNLFRRNSWFFAIVNYPDNSHWIFLGMHSGQKKYFVNDPLHDTGNVASMVRVVEAYIDLEAKRYCDEMNDSAPESAPPFATLQNKAWTYLKSVSQQQNDKSNCGVLSLIAFFRSMRIAMADPSVSADFLAARWKCNTTVPGQSHYRATLKAMLEGNDEDSVVACTYFSQRLPQYIVDGNLQYM